LRLEGLGDFDKGPGVGDQLLRGDLARRHPVQAELEVVIA